MLVANKCARVCSLMYSSRTSIRKYSKEIKQLLTMLGLWHLHWVWARFYRVSNEKKVSSINVGHPQWWKNLYKLNFHLHEVRGCDCFLPTTYIPEAQCQAWQLVGTEKIFTKWMNTWVKVAVSTRFPTGYLWHTWTRIIWGGFIYQKSNLKGKWKDRAETQAKEMVGSKVTKTQKERAGQPAQSSDLLPASSQNSHLLNLTWGNRISVDFVQAG